MIVPVYQGELCHPDIRGRVTALQQFMLGVGALIASAVGYGKSFPEYLLTLPSFLLGHTLTILAQVALRVLPATTLHSGAFLLEFKLFLLPFLLL